MSDALVLCIIMCLLMKEVCHRDLKLENTLLDGSPALHLKICDFGYSKVSLCLSRAFPGVSSGSVSLTLNDACHKFNCTLQYSQIASSISLFFSFLMKLFCSADTDYSIT